MTTLQLATVLAASLLASFVTLSTPLRVPVAIAELIFGVILGGTGFGFLDASDPAFSFLGAKLGFAMVMFVAGTHVPLRVPGLVPALKAGTMRALAVGALAVPTGYGVATLFGTSHGALYAVILGSSSAAIIMPALNGIPLTSRPIMEMLAQVAVADAACIVLLAVAIDPSQAVRRAIGAALVIGLAAVLGLLAYRAEVSGLRQRVHDFSENRRLAIELRTSLLALFGVAAVAEVFSVSVMLAGFATGLAIAAVGEPRRLANRLLALTEGLFAPVFFIWLGASLDLRAVIHSPSLLALGFVLGLAATALHSLLLISGQPWPLAAATSAQLGVPAAAAALGTSLGVLQPGEGAALLVGALVTVVVTAALSPMIGRLARTGAAAPAV